MRLALVLILTPQTVASVVLVLGLPSRLSSVVGWWNDGRLVVSLIVSPDGIILTWISLSATRVGIGKAPSRTRIVCTAATWVALPHHTSISATIAAEGGIGARRGNAGSRLVSIYKYWIVVITPGPVVVAVVAISIKSTIPPAAAPGIVAPSPSGTPSPS